MEQERQEENQKLTKKISPYKIIYPIIIGLAVVSYMLYKEFDPKAFDMITFTWNTVFWLFVAVLCMAIRDFGYIIRIKILSGGKLNWIQSIRIIFLWEFTSAVTPSAIGGTSLAILFVHKEGIGVGKSSAMVMATSFLDELYFIIMFPLILKAKKSKILTSQFLFVIFPVLYHKAVLIVSSTKKINITALYTFYF